MIKVSHFQIIVYGGLNFHSSYTLAQCLVSYFGDPWKFSTVYSVVFQAGTRKKNLGKNTEKIEGPENLMLKIPLLIFAG